jgi:hypothetical protein
MQTEVRVREHKRFAMAENTRPGHVRTARAAFMKKCHGRAA